MPRLSFLLAFMLFVFLGAVGLAFGQQNDGTIHLPPVVSNSPSMGNIPVRSGDDAQKEQMKKANELRQEEIRRDTEKLYQLSTELRDFVDKSRQGVLSLDAIKKAEQIEKLAHSVKSKMKQSY
jgi:hypothetical protein